MNETYSPKTQRNYAEEMIKKGKRKHSSRNSLLKKVVWGITENMVPKYLHAPRG